MKCRHELFAIKLISLLNSPLKIPNLFITSPCGFVLPSKFHSSLSSRQISRILFLLQKQHTKVYSVFCYCSSPKIHSELTDN